MEMLPTFWNGFTLGVLTTLSTIGLALTIAHAIGTIRGKPKGKRITPLIVNIDTGKALVDRTRASKENSNAPHAYPFAN